jgi:cytochrome b involved in lipid metabolism
MRIVAALFVTALGAFAVWMAFILLPSLQGNRRQQTLFSREQLLQYSNGRRILLAVLGSVFDVTAGRRHYGPGNPYNVFAGRDASRAFVTGKFSQDLNDDLKDFTAEQFAEAVKWRDFYANSKVFATRLSSY